MPRVFISYSHDNRAHIDAVREFADSLRERGYNAWIDQYVDPDEGWPRWMQHQLSTADFVLIVPTETYRRRFVGEEAPGKGLGVSWEGLLLTNRLYQSQGKAKGIRAAIVGEADGAYIPESLSGHSYFHIPQDWEPLERYLRGLPSVTDGPLPPRPPLPPMPRRWTDPPPALLRPSYGDILGSGTAKLPARPSPSQLLHPRYEVVPFYRAGRAALLDELDTWCTTGDTVRARLIHAPGGFGKTRLAIEWIRDRRTQGWAAGFLHADIDKDWLSRLLAFGMPVAVVIDYAESRRDLSALLEPVLRHAEDEGAKTPVRMLLLARTEGDWWNSLLASDERLHALLSDVPPLPLVPLADEAKSRVEVFQEAVNRFAAVRNRDVPPEAPDDLDDRLYDRVLYLHVAALVVVDGLELRPRTEKSLMDAILNHEERFWGERQLQNDRLRRLQVSRARQLVAAATLRGGFPTRDVGVAVTSAVLGEPHEDLLLLLHDIYGAQQGTGGTYVAPLEPDLLGEGMVRRTYEREGERRADFIERVFSDDDAGAMLKGFEVLGRTSVGGPEVQTWIDRLLAVDLEKRALLAFHAAKTVGERTAFSALGDALADALKDRGDAGVARAIARSGLPGQTIALGQVAEWVYQKLLNAIPDGDDAGLLHERARLLNNLGTWQSQLGQRQAALDSTTKAVRIKRVLATRDPDAFLPGLAGSLNNLGIVQSEFGQREKALESTAESVRIYADLSRKNPDAFRPAFARSLNNLGLRQSESGQREDAFESTTRAVRIYSEMAEKNPDAFLPELARSLNSLGQTQNELGKRQEALESITKAVRIYEELERKNPDAFLPDLAASLNNLGAVQSKLGLRQEALDSTTQAVRIRRHLARKNPNAFLPGLASSLNNLGITQRDLGHRREALNSAREAFDLHWQCFAAHPERFAENMVMSLMNLLLRLQEAGDAPDEQLRERIGFLRQLGATIPFDGDDT